MVTTIPFAGLGNQLFMAAAVIGYAKKHGQEFHIPYTTKNPRFWKPYLKNLINKNYNPRLKPVVIKELSHNYNELPFNDNLKGFNVFLEGYWQSEKYFIDYRTDVLKAFGFNWHLNKGTVAIHVRRGDYLKYPDKHPVVTMEYLTKAIHYFVELGYTDFKVFSDDIPWCKQNLNNQNPAFKDLLFLFSTGNNELQDLHGMSTYEHQIISNSSFSWWGAYLGQNENKIVIAPKVWFGPGNSHLDSSDIIPETWLRF